MNTTPCFWQKTWSGLEMSGQACWHQICKAAWNGTSGPRDLHLIFRCLDHCSSLCHKYFGLIWGNQCACGNDLPADKYKKDESFCDVPCIGDSSLTCGGPQNAINVYEIDDACATTESLPVSSEDPNVPGGAVTSSPEVSIYHGDWFNLINFK